MRNKHCSCKQNNQKKVDFNRHHIPSLTDLPQNTQHTDKRWSQVQARQIKNKNNLYSSSVSAKNNRNMKIVDPRDHLANSCVKKSTLQNRSNEDHQANNINYLQRMVHILEQQKNNQLNRKKLLEQRQFTLDQQNAELQALLDELQASHRPQRRNQKTARFITVEDTETSSNWVGPC